MWKILNKKKKGVNLIVSNHMQGPPKTMRKNTYNKSLNVTQFLNTEKEIFFGERSSKQKMAFHLHLTRVFN